MKALNEQLAQWEHQLRNDVKIQQKDIPILATIFSNEIKELSHDTKQEIRVCNTCQHKITL